MLKITDKISKVKNTINIKANELKERFGIDISINTVSNLDNRFITLWVLIFFWIVWFIFIKMYLEKYTEFKEHYISVINLKENIQLLEENKKKLKQNIKFLETIRVINPTTVDLPQKLYDIETIIKRSARFIDDKFFIGAYEEKKWTIKVVVLWIMHYDDIKRILMNLRRPKTFYDIKQIKIDFKQDIDKDTKKTDEYYNMELTLEIKHLWSN